MNFSILLSVLLKIIAAIGIMIIILKLLIDIFTVPVNEEEGNKYKKFSISNKLRVEILKFYSNIYLRYLHDQYIQATNKDELSFSIMGTMTISALSDFNRDIFFNFTDIFKFNFLLYKNNINDKKFFSIVVFSDTININTYEELIDSLIDPKKYVFKYIYDFNSSDSIYLGDYFSSYTSPNKAVKELLRFIKLLDATNTYISYDNIILYDKDNNNNEVNDSFDDIVDNITKRKENK